MILLNLEIELNPETTQLNDATKRMKSEISLVQEQANKRNMSVKYEVSIDRL